MCIVAELPLKGSAESVPSGVTVDAEYTSAEEVRVAIHLKKLIL